MLANVSTDDEQLYVKLIHIVYVLFRVCHSFFNRVTR